MKPQMKPMTVPDLFDAIGKACENAKELVADAQVLLDHQRYPRAYTLTEIALEELTKPAAYLWAASKIVHGNVVDWRRLDRDLHDHLVKIEREIFMEYMQGAHATDSQNVEDLMSKLLASRQVNDLKNYSLYTSHVDGRPTKPSEIISAQLATEWVRRSREQLQRVVSFTVLVFAVAGASGERLHQVLQYPNLDAQIQRLVSLENQFGGTDTAVTAETLQRFLSDAKVQDL